MEKKGQLIEGRDMYDVYVEIQQPNRFIVQVEKYQQAGIMPPLPYWEDIEEFSSLDEAKAFKRELDLEEGIVRE